MARYAASVWNRHVSGRVLMGMRAVVFFAALAPLLAAEDPREIVRRALEADRHNQKIARDYTYIERVSRRRTDGDGKPQRNEVRTYDVSLPEGTPYRRLIEIDDQPLPPDMERREREKLEMSLSDRRHESPGERARRIGDWEKKREKQRAFTRELLEAMDFRLLGAEELRGRKSWVIEATPHPGYQPRSAEARFLTKARGKLWIDEQDHLAARIEAEFVDDVSIGVFLARLHKGSRFEYDQARVNGEVWLPSRMEATYSMRILFARRRESLQVGYKDYRKFQAESHILSTGPQVETAKP